VTYGDEVFNHHGMGHLPTMGTSNPTLTVSVLALRSGGTVIAELTAPQLEARV